MKNSSRKYCEKKDSRFTLRLSSNEKLLLDCMAKRFGCSTSRYVYLMIKSAILPYEKQILSGDKTYDDFKALFNN